MKAILTMMVSLFFIAAKGDGDTGGVNFRPLTLEQGIAAAKSEKKPLYVHGYTDWCHYCMYMRDSVYPDKEVGDFYNAHFICIKINMEKEGKELNAALGAHTYPVMLFYDTNGEIMHRAAGRKYKQPFLDLGKEALDTTRQMRYFKRRYEAGTATPYEIQYYFRMQEIAGMDAQLMIDDYLRKISDSEFTDQNSWRIINDIIKDPTLLVMDRVLDHKKILEEKYTTDSVNNKLVGLYNTYLVQFVQQLDSAGFEAAKRKIRANKKLDISEKICAFADLNKLKMKSDWNTYRVEGQKFLDKYGKNDYRRVNEVTGVFYDRLPGDTALMKYSERWLKESLAFADNYRGNHLLAAVSFCLGKKQQALQAADHAIELAKKDKKDYSMTTQLIPVIQRMKD